MVQTFSEVRKICERLNCYAKTFYKARQKDGVYYFFEDNKILFQTTDLKKAMQFIMELEIKIKGLF